MQTLKIQDVRFTTLVELLLEKPSETIICHIAVAGYQALHKTDSSNISSAEIGHGWTGETSHLQGVSLGLGVF